ncbi:MAG: hypothetical protein KAR12_04615 [Methylococcales bacterium]|nr:hypothetical protein [Methylococcales bacterium]
MKRQGKSRGDVKYYGTTKSLKKTPLIIKDFFGVKFTLNYKSMTWGRQSHEDGLI